MASCSPYPSRRSTEKGGVTILVALMMLVFLTLVATGLSRNSFREVILSGTARQGSMARNASDSGVEWSIFWLDDFNSPSATLAALQLSQLKAWLLADSTKAGIPYNPLSGPNFSVYNIASPPAPPTDLTFTVPMAGATEGVSVALTCMGKMTTTDSSQGVGQGAFAPAAQSQPTSAPNIWAVRSDAQLKLGGTTFIHSKEAWITTPAN